MTSTLRRPLLAYLALLVPVMVLAALYAPYNIDGDAVAYMDIADLLRTHHFAGAVNGYWHPLYPAFLALGQTLLHPARTSELGAYYAVNYVIFFAQAAAMLAFITALVHLRARMAAAPMLLSLNALRFLGLGLLVIATQRELSLANVRPDGLLQALLLFGMAALMAALSASSLPYAAIAGACFGLAYLTKSFAFLVALLAIAAMTLFAWRVLRSSLTRSLILGATAAVVFAAIAGPYIAALSHQKHRLTFGDSGALNYAWYVGGTEKMHLEPWMSSSFGAATVHLLHPEQQLLPPQTPSGFGGIYSYRVLPYGTYPAWFDATYFNERIQPHIRLGQLAHRDARNAVLVVRYLFNHPEPLLLLALVLWLGATLRPGLRARWWWPTAGLGLAMWGIYGLVNIEERYVTVAYFAILLPVFAMLEAPERPRVAPEVLRTAATTAVLLLAFLALGETLRVALEERRLESVAGIPHGWYSPEIFGAAQGLTALGLHPGDEIACVGTTACLYDHYWARLAGVRILTEMYAPDPHHLTAQLDALPNREQAYDVLRRQGARVLVGHFDPAEMNSTHPSATGWLRLGQTSFYALPLARTAR